MSDFRDVSREQRFEQGFVDPQGEMRCVWADYAVSERIRIILHVEAEPELRGTGAAGRFMERLTDHARDNSLTLVARCAYAAAWARRNPQTRDVWQA